MYTISSMWYGSHSPDLGLANIAKHSALAYITKDIIIPIRFSSHADAGYFVTYTRGNPKVLSVGFNECDNGQDLY